jgi:hypothetical protein
MPDWITSAGGSGDPAPTRGSEDSVEELGGSAVGSGRVESSAEESIDAG